ncbi:tyrosine-type recombinase/integrase [Sinorhizobium fredii]|uniref:tyrosine-type recombinase/integrase n=1 Tax=Rhizobium fredii TaxID=380 RepID=UPI0035147735
MPKLTKTYIDKVQPPTEGNKIHWDDTVKGYGLRVSSAGKRVFVAQGRVRGKAVIITIGPFGTYSEDQARKKAQSILQDMREGIDPRDTKKADEAAKVTLQQVCDAYVARPGKLKESSKGEIKRHVEQVFEAWKNKPIASITEDDVRKRYRDMATKGLRGKGPAPGQANLSMTTLRALINYASRQYKRANGTPLIQHNPVDALKDDWIQLQPRTRDIDEKKVGAVWHKLTEARAELIEREKREDGKVNPFDRDALAGFDLVLFLLLTGARRNEGAMLTWDRVNIDETDPANCWWHLPDPKNRNPVWLPLSSQAVELLKSRKRVKDNPYVFTSRSKAGHIMDTRSPLERIGEVIGHPLSAHDLRRTFVSIAVATCGIDLYKMELLTNHVPKGVTAKHYLKTSKLQYLHPEVQAIGDWIEHESRLAAAKVEGENVVSLRA